MEWTDRVFINLMLILKGVVIGYGATVFLGVLRAGPPWESEALLATYLACVATTLLVLVAFVSQAFGSAHTHLHPTTPAILVAAAQSISEFIAYGLLETRAGQPLTTSLHGWFAVIAVSTLGAVALTTVVLGQIDSPRYEAEADSRQRLLVVIDRRGAAVMALVAFSLWLLTRYHSNRLWLYWVGASVIGVLALVALHTQQKKAGSTVSGDPARP